MFKLLMFVGGVFILAVVVTLLSAWTTDTFYKEDDE